MRTGGRPGAPRALAVPTGPLGSAGVPQTAETIFSCILTGPLGSAGPPQTAANIFSCIPERLTENWL